jgi:hypothetical protein
MASPSQAFPKTQLQMNTAGRDNKNEKPKITFFTAGYISPLTASQDKLYGFS